MAYTKTNWENLPSTNTPLNANNLNKIENELINLETNKVNITDNLLIFRGNIPSTDLNEITTTGIYYISNEALTNAPSGCDYSFLIVIGASLVHQYIIKPASNGQIYVREYSGYPSEWFAWVSK